MAHERQSEICDVLKNPSPCARPHASARHASYTPQRRRPMRAQQQATSLRSSRAYLPSGSAARLRAATSGGVEYSERNELLGGVIGNFHALEFLLRMFLTDDEGVFSLKLRRAHVGDPLPAYRFTDWSTLGTLILAAYPRIAPHRGGRGDIRGVESARPRQREHHLGRLHPPASELPGEGSVYRRRPRSEGRELGDVGKCWQRAHK